MPIGDKLSGGNYALKVFSNVDYALHWLHIA
jgi:hypothetical protein